MGNISYRLGREGDRKEILRHIEDAPVLVEAFERMQEHLLQNRVDLRTTPRIVGSWLRLDPDTEQFVGERADEANARARGTCRAPFVVPEQV
jgi:hypothetical protein